MPNLYHFAINAADVARARRFYEHVFGWRFTAWGPPGFYQIETNGPGDPPGIRGALQGRRELVPGQQMTGLEGTVSVPSIDETERAVLANGGKVVMPKSIIVGVGTLMFFQDTEGNVLGAIQPDAQAE